MSQFDVSLWDSAKTVTKPTAFEVKDADDLRATPMPTIQWAVPDILPEGLAILGGDPKIGKSWLALHLCGGIGGHGQVLGMIDVAYGAALYLALEDPEWRVTKRMNGMFGETSALPGFYCRTEMGPWGSADWDALSTWITQNNNLCRIVVVDTYAKMKPPDEAGLNAYEAANKLGKEMQMWAHKHHVCLLLVHHKSKTTDSADPVKSLSGSVGFSGSADTILLLSRTRTEKEAKLFITGRDVGEREINLTHEEGTGRWLMAGATVAQRHQIAPKKDGPIGIVPAPEPSYVVEACFACGNPVKERTEYGSVCRRCHPL